jgi:hypothetical protein
MPGQVRLVRDLLVSGRYKVMAHSALEEDFRKSRFDPDARTRKQFKWSSQHHPDAGDAARYSLGPYFNIYEKPDTRSDAEKQAAELAEDFRRDVGDIPEDVGYSDPDLEQLM